MKKFVVTAMLALAVVIGVASPASAHTSKRKVTHSSSYTKGFRGVPKAPNYYHKYWTGGQKNRQHGR